MTEGMTMKVNVMVVQEVIQLMIIEVSMVMASEVTTVKIREVTMEKISVVTTVKACILGMSAEMPHINIKEMSSILTTECPGKIHRLVARLSSGPVAG